MQSQQDGDAWLFTQIYKGQLCYDHAAGKWYEWKGHYWGEDKIKEIMRESPPIVAENTSATAVSSLLQYSPMVLVSDKGRLVGVITRSDVLSKAYNK